MRRVERTLTPKRPTPWLVASDALAILIFVTIGLISHHKGIGVNGYARDALPLLGGWFVAAVVFRLYVTYQPRRVLATWVVGITGGVVVRALILGRSFNGDEAAFLGVALVMTLLFVFLLRFALSLTPPR